MKIHCNTKIKIHRVYIKKSNIILGTAIFLTPFLSLNMIVLILSIIFVLFANVIIKAANKINFKCALPVIIFVCSYLFSITISGNKYLAIKEFITVSFACVWMLCVYGMCCDNIDEAIFLVDIYNYSALTITVCVLLSYYAPNLQFEWVRNLELVKTNNHFCYYVGASGLFFIMKFLDRQGIRYIFYAISIFIGINLMTGRGTLLAMVFSVIILVCVRSVYTVKYKIIILLGIICLFVFREYTQLIIAKVLKELNPQASFSNRERWGIWTGSFLMFSDHLFGVGGGNWADLYNAKYKLSTLSYPHTHNVYVQILCEIGIQGFLAFMYMIISTVIITFRLQIKGLDHKSEICLIFLIYSLAAFLFNHPLNSNKPLLLFYMFIGLGLSMNTVYRKRKGLRIDNGA